MLRIEKVYGRYVYGKNDLFALLISLKLLLPEDEFRALFYNLKHCLRTHLLREGILEKMGFPENWGRILRIKKYTKKELVFLGNS